jgi:hypothetical protein
MGWTTSGRLGEDYELTLASVGDCRSLGPAARDAR